MLEFDRIVCGDMALRVIGAIMPYLFCGRWGADTEGSGELAYGVPQVGLNIAAFQSDIQERQFAKHSPQ